VGEDRGEILKTETRGWKEDRFRIIVGERYRSR